MSRKKRSRPPRTAGSTGSQFHNTPLGALKELHLQQSSPTPEKASLPGHLGQEGREPMSLSSSTGSSGEDEAALFQEAVEGLTPRRRGQMLSLKYHEAEPPPSSKPTPSSVPKRANKREEKEDLLFQEAMASLGVEEAKSTSRS